MTTTRPVKAPPKRKLPFFLELYRSDVGKKWVMAVTGVILLGYVLAHMLGNLHIYEGLNPATGEWRIDEYGEFLRDILEPIFPRTLFLWILRVGLLAAFVLHIHAAYALTLKNQRARAGGYQSPRHYLAVNYASRTMRWSGFIVLAFVLWHLADLTWGVEFVNGEFVRGHVRDNLIASFSRWPVAGLYIVANLMLGMHIYHGAWSMFQSLGANNPRFNPWRRWFAAGFAAVIVIGNLSFPVSVLAGWIK